MVSVGCSPSCCRRRRRRRRTIVCTATTTIADAITTAIDDGNGEVFVHQTRIHKDGFRSLAEGEPLEFKGDFLQAFELSLFVDASAPSSVPAMPCMPAIAVLNPKLSNLTVPPPPVTT